MSDKNMRFTSRALRVFDLAREEAEKQGHTVINPEHLLLGLIREERGTVGQFLRELGLGEKEVQEFVSREPLFRRDASIGLMVLDTNGSVLYRNPAAQDVIDKHGAVLQEALSGLGPEGETKISIDDQSYLATTAPEPGDRTLVILQAVPHRETVDKDFNALAHTLTHDLRSPLTAIKGFAELIFHDAPPDGKEKRAAEVIVKAADELLDTVNLIYAWVIAKAAAEIDFKPCDLKAVVDRAVARLQDAANHNSVQVRFDYPTESCSLMGNELHLYHVVVNLLRYAIMYSPDDKEVSIELSRTPTEIRLCVRDEGVVLSPDDLKRIVPRPPKVAEPARPTSLRFSFVKVIVDRHGGTITEKSSPGEGTAIVVVLPALKREYTLS